MKEVYSRREAIVAGLVGLAPSHRTEDAHGMGAVLRSQGEDLLTLGL